MVSTCPVCRATLYSGEGLSAHMRSLGQQLRAGLVGVALGTALVAVPWALTRGLMPPVPRESLMPLQGGGALARGTSAYDLRPMPEGVPPGGGLILGAPGGLNRPGVSFPRSTEIRWGGIGPQGLSSRQKLGFRA